MGSIKIIRGRIKDLGGFQISRALPTFEKRHVGPFVFLDHMGPLSVDLHHALDVRPHPHIGLATVTYLFSGRGLHRDSLGSNIIIKPGDLNWMTAGRGITHSERTPQEDRAGQGRVVLHGIQIWVALPKEFEDCEPNFTHYSSQDLPTVQMSPEIQGKLLIGEAFNEISPVKTYSKTLLVEFSMKKGDSLELPVLEKEQALFIVSGSVEAEGEVAGFNDLIVMTENKPHSLKCKESSQLVLLGGEPHPEERFMWWNFVSSEKMKIHDAAKLWAEQKFPKVPGEIEFIPLPNDPLP